MPWTSAQDLRAQTQKLWDRGTLLADMVALTDEDSSLFPKRLRLLRPTTLELSTRFVEVRSWAEGLRAMSLASADE